MEDVREYPSLRKDHVSSSFDLILTSSGIYINTVKTQCYAPGGQEVIDCVL